MARQVPGEKRLAVRRRTTIAQKEPEKNDRKNDIVHTVHGTR